VHAYVIGEHGDSEVLTWSSVSVGGASLAEYCALRSICFDDEMRRPIDEAVRRAADHIIAGKGATYYGVGAALARLVHAVLHDQRAVLTVSTRQAEVAGVEEVTLSVPQLVGGGGAMAVLPLSLDESEMAALHASASLIRGVTDELAAVL
jgi:L-lactate dehydrogenase